MTDWTPDERAELTCTVRGCPLLLTFDSALCPHHAEQRRRRRARARTRTRRRAGTITRKPRPC